MAPTIRAIIRSNKTINEFQNLKIIIMKIMKTKILIGFFTVGLSIFILTSCNNSGSKMTLEKDLELQKKELELKEKELALKEKELSQQGSKSTNESESKNMDKNAAFYVINVTAIKTKSEAKKKVQELEKNGYQSDYLWIPDYASLSGALFYSVYIGPYFTQYDCEVATEEYRKKHPEAYGLLVSQDNKRVQINGVGKVTISEVPKQSSNSNVIQNSDFSDLKIFWEFFKKAVTSKDYKMLSEQTYFPFLNHGTYLHKKDFDSFTLPDYIIVAIKKAKPPIKSSMMFGGGSDSNGNIVNVDFNYKTKCELYEVGLGGPAIYFSKVNGKYKFIAILYGE